MSAASGKRQLVIEWDDPAAALQALRQMSGLDHWRAVITGELPEAPIGALLGYAGLQIFDGRALFRGQPGPQHVNSLGTVHGGFAATLLDAAMGAAIHTTLSAGLGYATVDLNVTFVHPITTDTGPVFAEGRAVHRGRTLRTASGRLTREADGRLLASATATCMLVGG